MNRTKTLLRAHFYIFTLLLGACSSPEGPRSIPEFSMVLTDTTKIFHSKDIPYGKPAMIIWFDPNCRDCQEETENLLANMREFQHANIYLVTKHSREELMVFYNHLKLDTCRNMKVGIDTSASIARQYRRRGTPLTLVYNKDQYLVGEFVGKPSMADLKKVIN
jgi:hypothetical protein